jgi:hypothetical protein
MCPSVPSFRQNNQLPFDESQRFNNRFNSILPTERGLVPEEVINDPRIILNHQSATEKLPVSYDPRYSS